PQFWRWSDAALDYAYLHNDLHTVFGWILHLGPGINPRSLRNFPMQANGAEMLRLGCCLATERDIRICVPVHDAILIEAPIDQIEAGVTAGPRRHGRCERGRVGRTPPALGSVHHPLSRPLPGLARPTDVGRGVGGRRRPGRSRT